MTKCTEAYLYINTLKHYITVGVLRYIMNIYKLFYAKNDKLNWRTADNIFYLAMIFKMRVVVMNAKKIYHILSDSSMCNIIIKNIFFLKKSCFDRCPIQYNKIFNYRNSDRMNNKTIIGSIIFYCKISKFIFSEKKSK